MRKATAFVLLLSATFTVSTPAAASMPPAVPAPDAAFAGNSPIAAGRGAGPIQSPPPKLIICTRWACTAWLSPSPPCAASPVYSPIGTSSRSDDKSQLRSAPAA